MQRAVLLSEGTLWTSWTKVSNSIPLKHTFHCCSLHISLVHMYTTQGPTLQHIYSFCNLYLFFQFLIFLLPTYLKLPSIHFILRKLHFYLFHIPWLLAYFHKPATTWTTASGGIIQNMAISITRRTHTSLEKSRFVPCEPQQQEHVPGEGVVAVPW